MKTSIVWFRNDLRVLDHPALKNASELSDSIIPVFIYSPDCEGDWTFGGASKWWLHHSLVSLEGELKNVGLPLIIKSGESMEILEELIKETEAEGVFYNRRYEPAVIKRDTEIKKKLSEKIEVVESYNGSLLFEPWEIQTKQDTPYKVYTPFWKTMIAKPKIPQPISMPSKYSAPKSLPDSLSIDELDLLPTRDWSDEFPSYWTPGSSGAKKQLKWFLKNAVEDYNNGRDLPADKGTSRLSPHLHFGEISPREVWSAVASEFDFEKNVPENEGALIYLKEIVWREFAYHILFHFPQTPNTPLHEKFKKFPWSKSKKNLKAWQKGKTGYPIVDAGMIELWKTGWMHNRVRMIVGSFLTKHLRIHWKEGADWFWDTLLDADLASNTMGWQWISGCGADAAPYFRIFNPMTQGKKFDPEGEYVKKWIPELNDLPKKWIHEPWEAPVDELKKANIVLGKDYPNPIVDHPEARKAALDAFAEIKN